MCPNYEYTCMDCGTTTIENHRIGNRPETTKCACGSDAQYRISSPNIMTAALPDGTKRRGFAELKEASKLNSESTASKSRTTKQEITKEIRKMGVRLTQ